MGTPRRPVILWFRNDLRLEDQPALAAAMSTGAPVVPVYILAPEEEAAWAPGGASRWWLHHSLAALEDQLRGAGSRLVLRRGPTQETLVRLVRETGAEAVFWGRRYEPEIIRRDTRLKEALKAMGVGAESSNAALLVEPWTLANRAGKPFQVFTPFWKACLEMLDPGAPTPAPKRIPAPTTWPESSPLEAYGLLPRIPWDAGFRAAWTPGEAGAHERLRSFLRGPVARYGEERNLPGVVGTSRLSPSLHFGEIGPRQVWHAVRAATGGGGNGGASGEWKRSQFIAEIGWREFAYHLLFHFPHTPTTPLRSDFARFPWRTDPVRLEAWRKGRTGFPLVDAGMRELWATGWMHNRVRMIVGSFLVKDLLISWEEGAAWFWDTLVDADLASNTLGWQWVAGCGADAAPYFRVFNPTSQGAKFDPEGDYVRRWVPELAHLPARFIHQPADAPLLVLREARVRLGETYPEPIVSHNAARIAALEAFSRIRGASGEVTA